MFTTTTLILLLMFSQDDRASDGETVVTPPKCCGVSYTSASCDCDAEKPAACPCTTCSHDEACACVADLKKGKGTVRGTVKNKYVRRYPTVVFIEETPGFSFRPPTKSPVMDQKGKEFKPHVLPVLVGTKVDFLNSDDFEHNVFSPDGEEYNLGRWTKGLKRSYTFKRPGVYVQLCSIHPEMVGYVFVGKTPYYTLAKKDGTFEIRNVPPGKWKIKVWNERFRKRSLQKTFEVTVTADGVSPVELEP